MPNVLDLLGPNGPLAAALAGYEHRRGQLEMALAVEEAFDSGRTLVCEAGTGTGKTLAYLVPAILSARKVLLSTATKALQDQVISHDLPTIRKHLGLSPHVAVAKGLSNYLCLRRFEEFRKSRESIRLQSARSLAVIERWAKTTETGDVAEIKGLAENDPVWSEVCSSAETRIGAKCAHYRDCFVTRMRRECDAADLIIANHHLFFADLSVRGGSSDHGGVLPVCEAVIFDEAHQLEDTASDFFGAQVSTHRVDSLLRDFEIAARAAGLRDPLLSGGAGESVLRQTREASKDFFEEIAACFGSTENGRKPFERADLVGRPTDAYHRFDAALEALGAFCKAHNKDDSVDAIGDRVASLRSDLSSIIDGSAHDVTWFEVRARSVVVGRTPIEVSSILRSQVFERIPAVILTSATLTSGGSFSFFRQRIGADSPHVSTRELSVASPFDYPTHALLYTPTDLPEPNESRFLEQAAQRIADLVEITGGGAFVLCTSLRAMSSIAHALGNLLAYPPMMQGQAPKGALIKRFREHGHAVLVATMSFWEGVDVPGDALRLVVIDKIPFAVPTDPVVVARCAAIEESGANPFVNYHVPLAAITLKQGFGRLIRTRKDRGIVAILDRRIVKKGYGKILRESLPPAHRTESIDEVRGFWARWQAESAGRGLSESGD